MDIPKQVGDAIDQAIAYLVDVDRFVLCASTLGWIAVTLLTYSVVLLLRVAIAQGAPHQTKVNSTLVAASRVAWEGSFVAWGMFFGFMAGWNTSGNVGWVPYLLAGILGTFISGGAATVIAHKLRLSDDVFEHRNRLVAFIIAGPLLFALMATLSNLVINEQVEAITGGVILLILIVLTVMSAVKMGVETYEKLSKTSKTKRGSPNDG